MPKIPSLTRMRLARRKPLLATIFICATALVLAGCSSSDDDASVASEADAEETTGSSQATQPTVADNPPDQPCDVAFNPAGYYEDATLAGMLAASPGMESDDPMAGMDHSQMDMDDGEMSPSATVEESDEPMDMSGGLGEVEAAGVIMELAQLDDAAYDEWLEGLNPNRDAAAPDDTGMGGHLGPQAWTPITDASACQQLGDELDTARSVAATFPKASDALAAGYVQVAPYLPGIASHWMNFALVDEAFDVTKPEMLLFDGKGEESNLVGLSYFIRSEGDAEPEAGFTGDNDHYHRHEGLCVSESGVIGDSTMSAEECEAIGGRKSDGGAGWMSHAWIVEGCESPWGVFSAQNPLLDQSLGESSGQGAPCSGSEVAARWDLDPPSGDE